MGESLVLPLELFYHSLLHIWLVGGVAIHLANSTSCKSSLMGVLRVANLVNCTHCPEAELCFYTGGRGCLTIVYTSYHMIYTQIWLAKMREKQLILFYWSFKINYACFSNVRILGYRNLFNGDLQRKPLEYQGKHLQLQTKITLWHIVWGSSRLFLKL